MCIHIIYRHVHTHYSVHAYVRTHYTCVHIIVNGSENADEIHCFKDGEDATLTAPAITDVTRKLLQEIESDEEDLFASLGEEERANSNKMNLLLILTAIKTMFSTTAMLHYAKSANMLKLLLSFCRTH